MNKRVLAYHYDTNKVVWAPSAACVIRRGVGRPLTLVPANTSAAEGPQGQRFYVPSSVVCNYRVATTKEANAWVYSPARQVSKDSPCPLAEDVVFWIEDHVIPTPSWWHWESYCPCGCGTEPRLCSNKNIEPDYITSKEVSTMEVNVDRTKLIKKLEEQKAEHQDNIDNALEKHLAQYKEKVEKNPENYINTRDDEAAVKRIQCDIDLLSMSTDKTLKLTDEELCRFTGSNRRAY